MLNPEYVKENLKNVFDPELGYDIVSLGLIYAVRVLEDATVEVDATLTSPGCPLADTIIRDITNAVSTMEGVAKTRVNIVWEPQYSIRMMDPDLRAELFPNYQEGNPV